MFTKIQTLPFRENQQAQKSWKETGRLEREEKGQKDNLTLQNHFFDLFSFDVKYHR
jgi:hypothetical protein